MTKYTCNTCNEITRQDYGPCKLKVPLIGVQLDQKTVKKMTDEEKVCPFMSRPSGNVVYESRDGETVGLSHRHVLLDITCIGDQCMAWNKEARSCRLIP